MKKVIFAISIVLCFAACEKNGVDYSVRCKEYTYNKDTSGYHSFIFFDDYVQVILWFDSITPNGFHDGTTSCCDYEQKGQNVTVFDVTYDVPPHEKDSDLHIVSYGDYIIHDGRKFSCQ